MICLLVHGMAAMKESDWSATTRADNEQAAMTLSSESWWCDCWNTTEQEEVLECRCKGVGLLDVPNNLHSGVQTL
jgi:hypothetical protein